MNVLAAFAPSCAAVLISATVLAFGQSFFADPSALINDDPVTAGAAASNDFDRLFSRSQLYKLRP